MYRWGRWERWSHLLPLGLAPSPIPDVTADTAISPEGLVDQPHMVYFR